MRCLLRFSCLSLSTALVGAVGGCRNEKLDNRQAVLAETEPTLAEEGAESGSETMTATVLATSADGRVGEAVTVDVLLSRAAAPVADQAFVVALTARDGTTADTRCTGVTNGQGRGVCALTAAVAGIYEYALTEPIAAPGGSITWHGANQAVHLYAQLRSMPVLRHSDVTPSNAGAAPQSFLGKVNGAYADIKTLAWIDSTITAFSVQELVSTQILSVGDNDLRYLFDDGKAFTDLKVTVQESTVGQPVVGAAADLDGSFGEPAMLSSEAAAPAANGFGLQVTQ